MNAFLVFTTGMTPVQHVVRHFTRLADTEKRKTALSRCFDRIEWKKRS
jgi:hypothetical protein